MNQRAAFIKSHIYNLIDNGRGRGWRMRTAAAVARTSGASINDVVDVAKNSRDLVVKHRRRDGAALIGCAC